MITDELFTAVTGIAGSYKDYKINQIINGECYLSTHDLTHLCKEWVFSNKFIINTSRVLSEKNYSKHVVQLHHFYNPDMERKANKKFYYANEIIFDTESEALFAACQWILEERH